MPLAKLPKAKPVRVPRYCLHKATGLAYVTVDGKEKYLGPYQLDADGKPACPEYHRLIADWLARKQTALPSAPSTPHAPLTIAEMLVRYWSWCKSRYCHADGTPTGELDAVRAALRPLNRMFGDTAVNDFGPKKYKAVREEMKRLGWCRTNISRQLFRVRNAFRWAVEEELMDGAKYHAIQTVKNWREAEGGVRESKPVQDVKDATIEATLPFLGETVAAMVRLQRATGMRPGELVIMRACDIEMTNKDGKEIWTYRPSTHKNKHRGHVRQIPIGPKAREIIRPFLTTKMDAYLFVPMIIDGTPGERYDVGSYRRAITRACDRAFPLTPALEAERKEVEKWACKWMYDHSNRRPQLKEYPKELQDKRRRVEAHRKQNRWHPHQIRHATTTEVDIKFGADAARALAGHTDIEMTRHYAHGDLEKARAVVEQIG